MKKRKFLTGLTCLLLSLLLPVSTLAATHEVDTAEEFLTAIMEDADADVTIVMKADIDLNGNYIEALEGKTYTINGTTYVLSNVTVFGNGKVEINADVNGKDNDALIVEGGDVTVNGDITSDYNGVIAYNGGKVTVNGDITSETTGVYVSGSTVNVNGNVTSDEYGVNALGSADLTIEGNVTGKSIGIYAAEGGGQEFLSEGIEEEEEPEINITVGGDVSADNATSIISYGATIVVEGNVIGGNGTQPDEDGNLDNGNMNEPGGYSDGVDAINAYDDSHITVNGNVTGGDGYGTYAYAGNAINAESSTVIVGGDVSGGNIIANPEVPSEGNISSAGNGVVMSADSTVIVKGNVTGGNTNGADGKAGDGVYIVLELKEPWGQDTPEEEIVVPGTLFVGGSIKGGESSSETGIDGNGIMFDTYSMESELALPPATHLMSEEGLAEASDELVMQYAYKYAFISIEEYADASELAEDETNALLEQYYSLAEEKLFPLIEFDPYTESFEDGLAKYTAASEETKQAFIKAFAEGYNEIISNSMETKAKTELDKVAIPEITVYEIAGATDGQITESTGLEEYVEAIFEEDYNYIIKTKVVGNGSVSVDKETAKEGEIVTVTAKADKGYKLVSVTLHGEELEAVDGVYTFEAVKGGDHTVTATFEKIPETPKKEETPKKDTPTEEKAPETGDVTNVASLLSLLMMSGTVLVGRRKED